MNADRETKTITTTSGIIVVFKAYLTGRENNQLKSELFKGVIMNGETGEKPKLPLENVIPYERKIIETLLVSVGDETGAPIAALEELPTAEYEDAVRQIKEGAGLSLAVAK